jgi:hypothetical protein
MTIPHLGHGEVEGKPVPRRGRLDKVEECVARAARAELRGAFKLPRADGGHEGPHDGHCHSSNHRRLLIARLRIPDRPGGRSLPAAFDQFRARFDEHGAGRLPATNMTVERPECAPAGQQASRGTRGRGGLIDFSIKSDEV